MKKTHLALALTASAAFGLCGCADIERFEDFVTSPKTAQAVSVLKTGASALVCSVADAALAAQRVETAVGAGQSVQGTDGKLYVASAIVCASLGGTVTGTGVVP